MPSPVVTLCLSVASTASELVVVRGDAVLDRVHTPTSRLEQAVDTVLQTRKLAIVNGYRVDTVGVIGHGSDDVIAALRYAGLGDVTALNPAVAGEIFTHRQVDGTTKSVSSAARTHCRRRWMFTVAMVIACAALLFAIVDRWEAGHRQSEPGEPAVAPRPDNVTTPRPPANPTTVAPPPSSPAHPIPEPPAPTSTPTRQAPVERQPAPQLPSPPPLVELPEPAPAGNCLFLCGVTL